METSPDGAGQTPGAETEDPKTFDLAYVQKLRAEAAGYRTKAKEGADAIAKLAAMEDAAKTADEKTADTLAKMQAQLDAQAAATQRATIALKFGLTPEDAALLTGDEDTMTALATRLAKDATKPAPHAPSEGRHKGDNEPSDKGLRAVTRGLFGNDE